MLATESSSGSYGAEPVQLSSSHSSSGDSTTVLFSSTYILRHPNRYGVSHVVTCEETSAVTIVKIRTNIWRVLGM